MMRYKTSNKRRGTLFEYRIKKKLEELGFTVFRSAGSKPIDLIAFSPNGNVYLIECKLRGYASRQQKEKERELAKRINATYLIITSRNQSEVFRDIKRRERIK